MTTCKIVGCRQEAERESLCGGCYTSWLATGELPGPVKPGRSGRVDLAIVDGRTEQKQRSQGRALLLEAADAVVACARKWAANDERLKEALEAYEERYGTAP